MSGNLGSMGFFFFNKIGRHHVPRDMLANSLRESVFYML